MLRIKEAFVVVLFSIVFTNGDGKIIIDNDAGSDDAMAIFMALLYEEHFNGPSIIALTTGNGNVDEDQVCVNNKRILKVARRSDTRIFRGSKTSIVTTPSIEYWFGKDGLGDVEDENSEAIIPIQNKPAAEALILQSKIHEGELTVITIGTLSNVALAIKVDPNFLSRLKHLYIGAGHIHDEIYSKPEFNAYMDVEAYHIVAQHATPDKVTMLPFSTTKHTLDFDKEWRQNVLGSIDTDIVRALNKYERISMNKTTSWSTLDPSVLAVTLKPELVEEYKYSKTSITLCGAERGITEHKFVEDKNEANVRVIVKVKPEEYKQFLIDVFSSELKPTEKKVTK